MILAIKKGITNRQVEWLDKESEEFIGCKLEIQGETWLIGNTYMREEEEKIYDEMEKLIEEGLGEKVYIGGDFNARTGREGGWKDLEQTNNERISRDEVTNENGKRLLEWMEDNGMRIINGNIEGEREPR